MKISSSAFANGGKIPDKYAYEGANTSPPLQFSDVPKMAKTLALIVDDPDAPHGTFDHWVTWNIDSTVHELAEGAALPHSGMNHYNKLGYCGPCPPPGKPHRYFFKIYALDTALNLPEGCTKQVLEHAMEGHIVAKAEIVGTYAR